MLVLVGLRFVTLVLVFVHLPPVAFVLVLLGPQVALVMGVGVIVEVPVVVSVAMVMSVAVMLVAVLVAVPVRV
jgi:hypothetical protein